MAASGASAESLTAALASAYSNNPDIIAANLAAQVASEGIVAAKSGLLPTIGLTGSLDGSTKNTSGITTNSGTGTVGLGYSQTIFDNGVTQASVESARAGAEAAMEQARNTEQTVLFSAAQTYYSVAVNQEILKLRQDSVDYYQAQVKAAKDRLNVGEGTQTDVAQAQSQLASALADQQKAAADLAVSEAN
ncbi:MAG: TolC family protein, partial [Novosphingobium sp.]